jgi:hypothetical protein
MKKVLLTGITGEDGANLLVNSGGDACSKRL